MTKLAERFHDAEILKEVKIVDAISIALKNNEASPWLNAFVIQTKPNLRTFRRGLKTRIQLNENDSRSGNEVI